jgi:hypothetical protein
MLAALGVTAVCANAAQFKMNVPLEARWGDTVLPAGEYTVSAIRGTPLIQVTGNGKNITLMLSSTEVADPKTRSRIQLVRRGNVPLVSEVTSQSTGTTYRFFVPKTMKNIRGQNVTLAKAMH